MNKTFASGGLTDLFEYLPTSWEKEIRNVPREVFSKAAELRVRLERGVSLSVGRTNFPIPSIRADAAAMDEIRNRIGRGALYRFETQIRNGFIPLPGGHRCGIAGSFIRNDRGEIVIHHLSSLNFRISRSCAGIADGLFPILMQDGRFCSTLIASEPSGGKTSVLTDLIRILSLNGIRSAVADERGEIAAVFQGVPQKEIGAYADVLDGYPKAYGMAVALRTLSPQVLVCDEIGSAEEATEVLEAVNAGVPLLISAHADSLDELQRRPQVKRLLDSAAFSRIVFLKGAYAPGEVREVYCFDALKNTWRFADHWRELPDRQDHRKK